MENYTSKNIQYLDGIEHIRDIGIRKIRITFHKNEYITVLDNGRGIPVDFYKNKGISTLEVIMTKVVGYMELEFLALMHYLVIL
ncbi:MAG: hypothetical protein ACE19P_01140 [Candidatus Karelsulcia muelleri]